MESAIYTIGRISSYVAVYFLLTFQSVNAQTIDASRVDVVITEALSSTGSSSFIFRRGETVLLEKYYFEADEKITPTTRIKISSASMWLVSATLLSLVDKGLITLDTEIGRILPQFRGEKGKITLRQLLSHTSGLPSNSIYLKDRSLTLAQSVDSIAYQTTLLHSPGKAFTFGAVSMQVAARIAEVITGKSWEQVFYEQMARPCQMILTDFGKARSVSAADGAYSTARDYANFLSMLLNKGKFGGSRVLSEKMIEEMFTVHTDGLPLGYTPYRTKTEPYSRFYGLGVWIERINPLTKIGTEVSCQGARGFTPWLNTCNNTAGVFAVYSDVKSVQSVIDKLKTIVAEHFPTACNDISTEHLTSLDMTVESTPPAAAGMIFITFRLEEQAHVTLKLYDPLGNEIENLLSKQLAPGEHSVPLSTKDLPPGIYFYRLKVNERIETKKIQIRK